MDEFCWNGCIAFYIENYLVLSCIGWLGLYDIRFLKENTASENFSSVLALILSAFSVGYPIFIAIFYFKNFKPILRNFRLRSGKTAE
jgi:hypothetical protein